eukprot:TRINITY_DN27248_c0_g1_i2.p1 TRINITY_DN27248_c0_g1~~TRINITY_DN27248_c0_g1_i2.p1  ORF type:complete len:601 (-),score=185.68 TRINITY_DN27248_c0_g1_i2:304-2106(-)
MSLAGVLGVKSEFRVTKGSFKRKKPGLTRSTSSWGISKHHRAPLSHSKSYGDLRDADVERVERPNQRSGSFSSYFPPDDFGKAPSAPRPPVPDHHGKLRGPSLADVPDQFPNVNGDFVDDDDLLPGEETSPLLSSLTANSVVHEKKSLTFGSLVFLAYFCVCGGPYGLEVAVQAGYPLYTLIGLIVVPWLWSLPLALMCAELSTALPDNDGYILWVKTAFGPFAGYLVGFIGWANGVVDNALYPVLFMAYLKQLLEGYDWINEPAYFYSLQTAAILLVMGLNLVGVDVVGRLSALFAVVVLAPFGVLLIWAIVAGRMQPAGFIAMPPDLDGLTVTLNVIIWANSGYDSLSNVASELSNPKQTFPRAMACVILLTTCSYLLAFAGSVGVDTDYGNWTDGYLAVVAGEVGGYWFQTAMTVAAMISSLGIFNALMCTTSQELRGLGKKDLLGIRALVWRHPRFRTPWLPIMFNCCVIFGFGFLDFSAILQLNNIFYCMLLLMQYSSLICLRFTHKEIERPYRISKSFPKTMVFITPPILLCFYIIGSATYYDWLQLVIAVGFVVAVSLSYVVLVRCRGRPLMAPKARVGINTGDFAPTSEDED